MPDPDSMISAFAEAAARLLPHRFSVVRSLDDGPTIPTEALSEDHSIGIYWEVAPWKMLEHIHEYEQIEISDLRPRSTLELGVGGSRHEWFLEYVPLRGVRFRVEQLQYIEEGWTSTLSEVKYPAQTVLVLAHLVSEASGSALIHLNPKLPMPLWIRAHPLGSPNVGIQVAVQARAGDRMRPTNIHTEAPMEYARRWVAGARSFFEPVSDIPES